MALEWHSTWRLDHVPSKWKQWLVQMLWKPLPPPPLFSPFLPKYTTLTCWPPTNKFWKFCQTHRFMNWYDSKSRCRTNFVGPFVPKFSDPTYTSTSDFWQFWLPSPAGWFRLESRRKCWVRTTPSNLSPPLNTGIGHHRHVLPTPSHGICGSQLQPARISKWVQEHFKTPMRRQQASVTSWNFRVESPTMSDWKWKHPVYIQSGVTVGRDLKVRFPAEQHCCSLINLVHEKIWARSSYYVFTFFVVHTVALSTCFLVLDQFYFVNSNPDSHTALHFRSHGTAINEPFRQFLELFKCFSHMSATLLSSQLEKDGRNSTQGTTRVVFQTTTRVYKIVMQSCKHK